MTESKIYESETGLDAMAGDGGYEEALLRRSSSFQNEAR